MGAAILSAIVAIVQAIIKLLNVTIDAYNKKKDPSNQIRLLEIKTFEDIKEATNIAEEIFEITDKVFMLRDGEDERVVKITKRKSKKYWEKMKEFKEHN